MTNNAIKLMHNIWKHLLLIDPSESTIEQWNLNSKSNAKPLRINSTFPTSKAAVHEKLIEDLKINNIQTLRDSSKNIKVILIKFRIKLQNCYKTKIK